MPMDGAGLRHLCFSFPRGFSDMNFPSESHVWWGGRVFQHNEQILLCQSKNFLTSWVPQTLGNWLSWTETVCLPARTFRPGLNSKRVPEPDEEAFPTYLVVAKALPGLWEIVIQISVPEWSGEYLGHRKWKRGKVVRGQLQPLRSFSLREGT